MKKSSFQTIEFGVCAYIDNQESLVRVPIDDSVRKALVEMYDTFYDAYNQNVGAPIAFEPSEKYGTTEKLKMKYDSEDLMPLRGLFEQSNIPIAGFTITQLAKQVKFYFAIFHKAKQIKYIAVKRPSQFKGLLDKKLIYFVDDTLRLIDDNIFKLDNDFDFIITGTEIDILRPTGFIFIADIERMILTTAASATKNLMRRIKFVNFEYLSKFVGTSKTAAKLIASIKSRDDLARTSHKKLQQKCKQLGVKVREENGMITPEDDHIIRFLQILDRREYDVDLTEDTPEIYLASSRRRLK